MNRVKREIIKAYIIAEIYERPYASFARIKESINRQLVTTLRSLLFRGGLTDGTIRALLGELRARGILFQDPSRLWAVNLPNARRERTEKNERTKLYRQGLSDHEMARREGVTVNAIHDWRRCRRLPPNYPPGFRGAVLSHAKRLVEESK